jgi:GT2 family glycosyltransferase
VRGCGAPLTRLTVGITTRNRPAALDRCVRSLHALAPLAPHVVVFDDASDVPVGSELAGAVPPGMDLTVIRDEGHVGYIVGRNRIVREAVTPYVLLLDDDAVVFAGASVDSAIAVLDADAGVAAVGFAQAEVDGSPWPDRMQPGRGSQPVYVSAFIGFAHLLRRDTFLRLAGYRETFVFYGEEKDFCVRVLDAGLRVVYLPGALIGHIPDRAGRTATRYVRFVIRNDCLYSLYNEPWPIVALSLPLRFWRYRRMKREAGADAGGVRWILGELGRTLPDVRRNRHAVSWSTFREWRRLARTTVPYRPSERA